MTGRKTLVIFPDWDSIVFWRDDAGQTVTDERLLPISESLKQELTELYKHFSDLYFSDRSELVPDIEWNIFDEHGLKVWRNLIDELGSAIKVIYFSQEFDEYVGSPEELIELRKRFK